MAAATRNEFSPMTIAVLQGGNVRDLERGVLFEYHFVVVENERIIELMDPIADWPNARVVGGYSPSGCSVGLTNTCLTFASFGISVFAVGLLRN